MKRFASPMLAGIMLSAITFSNAQAQMIAPLPIAPASASTQPKPVTILAQDFVGPPVLGELAPTTDALQCLAFPTTLQLAMSHSPERNLAQAERQIAEARMKQEKGTGLPSLAAYARAADGDTGLVDGRTNTQTGLIASQRLFDFGQGHFRMKAARERSRAALFSIVDATTQARVTAGESYLDILEGREKLAAAQRRLARFVELSDGVDRRLEAGLITKATASSIRAEAASAAAQKVEVELALDTAKIEISLLTGSRQLPCNDSTHVAQTLDIPPIVMNGPFDSLNAALAVPEVKAAIAMREAALADLENARRVQRRLCAGEAQAPGECNALSSASKAWAPINTMN